MYFMRKAFVYILSVVLLLTFCFSVSAEVVNGSGSGNGVNQNPSAETFVDFLDNSLFDVVYYDDSGNVIRSDLSTSKPWSAILGFSSISIEWSIDHPLPIENIFLSYRVRGQGSVRFYVNNIFVSPSAYSVNNYLQNNVYELTSNGRHFVSSLRLVITGADPLSSVHFGIVSCLGNVKNEFNVTSGSYALSIEGLFRDGDHWFSGINTFQSMLETNTFIFGAHLTLPNSNIAQNKFLFGIVDLVIPLNDFNSDCIDFVNWNVSTFGEYISCSAYISTTAEPNNLGVAYPVEALPISCVTYQTEVVPPNEVHSVYCYGYQFQFDLSDHVIKDKYLHVRLMIEGISYSYHHDMLSSYVVSDGLTYRIDFNQPGHLLDSVCQYLYIISQNSDLTYKELNEIYDLVYDFLQNYNIPDYSVALNHLISLTGDNKNLLSLILNAIHNQPNYESILVELLSSLGSVSSGIQNIYDWLINFTPESGSDFNNSVSISQNIYQDLDQQLSIIETVPRTSLEEFENQNDHLMSVVDNVLPVSGLNKGDFEPGSPTFASTPLTFTAISGFIFDQSILGGFPLGEILLLVCSIALVGYVLFGKRG